MWLHAEVFHVLANVLSLVFIGIRLGQEFGFEDILFSVEQRKEFIHRRWGSNFSFRHSIPFYRIKLLETEAERLFQFSITSVGTKIVLDILSNWFPISHVWLWWEFAFSSFYSIWYFCWCFWCTFGLLGSMLSELTSNWTMYVNKFKWLTQQNASPGRVTTPVQSKQKTLCICLFLIRMVWRRHCVIAILCVILIDHFVDSDFYFAVLDCLCWQYFVVLLLEIKAFSDRSHVFDKYTLGLVTLFRGQSKQPLFLVSLFELCPYIKMELQVAKYLLSDNMMYFSAHINFCLNI
ncbi:hypothetical protein DVH24_032858 [Malus domestica]|uniref:Peptidase S54 rhomboid domain-containing protein n=1 Tax=Malus domestica TaxID=3750 RepID=A0A498IQS0_MALDO|nr:hypothetical protein DVH24_032858 [Malus domestica]